MEEDGAVVDSNSISTWEEAQEEDLEVLMTSVAVVAISKESLNTKIFLRTLM